MTPRFERVAALGTLLQAIQRAVDRGFKFSEPAKPSKPVNDK